MIRWKFTAFFLGIFLQYALALKDAQEPLLKVEKETLKLEDFYDNQSKYDSKVQMSINPGCSYNNCTLVSGIQVSIINVTVQDDPRQDDEQHWIWSVIGRPTVQAALTPPNDIAHMNWTSIFDASDTGKSIWYEKEPLYSGAVMLTNVRS